jgi:acyl carrier protein
MSKSVGEIKKTIQQMVAGHLDGKMIKTDEMLLDSGLSSQATTELSMKLSKEFGVKIRPTVMFTSPTIDAIAIRVQELMDVNKQAVTAPTEEEEEEEEVVEDNVRHDAHTAESARRRGSPRR